jgi:diguanylate cyclase (GGDEF)-like protein
MRSVNLLALSFSVLSVNAGAQLQGFCHRQYWTQTLAMALGSRIVAQRFARTQQDEAFLAGLLARFGQMLLVERAAEDYRAVLERRSAGERLDEVERDLLGATSAEVAGELLRSWGLPTVVCDAISAQHDPTVIPEGEKRSRVLAQLLHFAAALAELLSGEEVQAAVERAERIGADHFDLSREGCAEVLSELAEQLPDAARALELETEDSAALTALQGQATQLLLRESMALQEQVDSVQSELQEMEQRAATDPLTGLCNRGEFDSALNAAIEANGPVGLIILDLDHFKRINDTHGHGVGDQVLRRMGALLRERCEPAYAACRYGGEEFAVVCAGVGREAVEMLAEELGASLAELEFEFGRVTASIGVCYADASAGDAGAFVRAADEQLYAAKGEGRACVKFTDRVG